MCHPGVSTGGCRDPTPASSPNPSAAVEKPERGDPTLTSKLPTANWGSQLDLIEAQGVEFMDVEPEED